MQVEIKHTKQTPLKIWISKSSPKCCFNCHEFKVTVTEESASAKLFTPLIQIEYCEEVI